MQSTQEKPSLVDFNVKLTEMAVENMKKATEISMGYMKDMEKNQREFMKSAYDLFNATFPNEGKLWEMQSNMMQKTFETMDKTYEKLSGVWKSN